MKASLRKLKFLMIGGVAVWAAVSALPAVSHAESLEQALVWAYRSNPSLRAERARQRVTDEQVPQAKSGWRPRIDAQASLAHRWNIARRSGLFGGLAQNHTTNESTPQNLSIQLSQPLFRGFKTVEGIKAAEANVEVGRQQLLATEQDILFRTVQAYMNVIRDRKILRLREQNTSVLAEQASAARQRFAVGEITRTDVSQAEARVSQARADAANARAQLAASVASYVTLVGKEPGSLKVPKLARLPRSLQAALNEAQKINPNVLAAASVAKSAKHRIEVAKGDLLPSAAMQMSAVTEDDWSRKGGNTSNFSIEGVINIPIYEGGSVYSNVRQAKQEESQRKIEIIEATRQVREGVTSAWNNLQAAQTAIAANRAQVAAAELAASGAREEYLVGSRSTIEVLNAQLEVVNARVALVVAERQQVVASYQILGSIGRLTARDLRLPTTIYNPEANYNRVKDKWIGTGVETVE